jgi:hypothetical protein
MLLVQAKACSIFEDLSKGDGNVKQFSASAGWFSRFTKRYTIFFITLKWLGQLLLLTEWRSYSVQGEVVKTAF